jgi:DNA-binding Lrp family transcriptional regulator
MQTELSGQSVIFVKVAPGYVEKTLTTLRGKPNVASAVGVLGRHDIAVAGNFRDSDALRGFQSEVQLLDHVRSFRSYPALWNWTPKATNGHAISAYVLIRSSNPKQAISELEKLPMIQGIIGTTGDSDIVVRIGADSNEDLRQIVVNQVQTMPGVLSTETLLAFPKN